MNAYFVIKSNGSDRHLCNNTYLHQDCLGSYGVHCVYTDTTLISDWVFPNGDLVLPGDTMQDSPVFVQSDRLKKSGNIKFEGVYTCKKKSSDAEIFILLYRDTPVGMLKLIINNAYNNL